MPETIRTRVVRAAGFADVLRRAAFAVFGKKVPSQVIVRDVGQLNKKIFEELVNRGVKKEDYIRITVEGEYDEEKQEIRWSNLVIERFIPETSLKDLEEKLKQLEEENKKLREEIDSLRRKYSEEALREVEELRRSLEEARREAEEKGREVARLREELDKARGELDKVKARVKELEEENSRLRGSLRAVMELASKALAKR
ncbi:MAG: hypothetical protein DRN15_06105 [Thermoprotei archaeon]|nr:MAG: hypothetical protein DRN15_06105 [Thermoprotei archaeon]RLF25304.1 MAG: hypothetical protein DRM97_02305 [Thermoprotei archaeon]